MGGGVELEFPGYHIFASVIILMTGLPNYLAQAIVVALFSALMVLAVFLVTRIVWNESAALVAAFFVAISRFDVEMISWGGYPNIIAFLLILATFYLFLKRDKITLTPFLLSTSLLAASIFLTHSPSAAIFTGVTVITLLAVLISPKTFNDSRKNAFYLILPMSIGAILVSPFLASAAIPYLNESSTIAGATAIQQALLAERSVPLEIVLAFFSCIVPLFLLSKKYKRFLSLPIFIIAMWILVPLLLTQAFLVGLYVDYVRFLYFLIAPVLILLAVISDCASRYCTKVIGTYYGLNGQNKKIGQSLDKLKSRILARIDRKTVYVAFLAGFLLISLCFLPIFWFPGKGIEVRNFYQVMSNEGYQAIQWVKQNTPVESVFVSDFYYGWWLGGFGQRPTIAAVDLQYLTLAREVSIAKNASYLLDTDYVIDNGYIQVREDGGYIGRHNPLFLVNLNWTNNSPYGFFQFNSSDISMLSHNDNNAEFTNIVDLPVTDMMLFGANSDSSSIIVNRANSNFSYSKITTVTKGQLFANMTITIQRNNPNVSLDWLNLVVASPGIFQQSFNNTLYVWDPDMKLCGQLIFAQSQPTISNYYSKDPCITQLSYNLQGKSRVEIQILVGIYSVSDSEIQNPMSPSGLRETVSANLKNQMTGPDFPVTTFDYKVALQQYGVSYVANRDFELNPKYSGDPEFSLEFINAEVVIFKVEAALPVKG